MSDSIFALKFTVKNGGLLLDHARQLAKLEEAIERACDQHGADVWQLSEKDWTDPMKPPAPAPKPELVIVNRTQTPEVQAKRRKTMKKLWSIPAQRKRFLAALAAGRQRAMKARHASR